MHGASAPTGWLLCAGQAVSRSTYAALFAVVSTIYGSGDGSTTFNLPDLRGRTVVGKDDMGGTAANRVTAGISGIAGITLGATGGSESVHQHQHSNTASFTGSAVTSGSGTAHFHANTASATFTGTAGTTGNDSPDHSHTYTIPNWNANVAVATSSILATTQPYASSVNSGGASVRHQHSFTPAGTVAVTMTNANESAHTHSVTAAGTVTMTNANFGSGSSQNMQPSIILNYIIKY